MIFFSCRQGSPPPPPRLLMQCVWWAALRGPGIRTPYTIAVPAPAQRFSVRRKFLGFADDFFPTEWLIFLSLSLILRGWPTSWYGVLYKIIHCRALTINRQCGKVTRFYPRTDRVRILYLDRYISPVVTEGATERTVQSFFPVHLSPVTIEENDLG